MKKIISLLFIVIAINISIFAETNYYYGLESTGSDIGVFLSQKTDKIEIKAGVGYPLIPILAGLEFADNYKALDFFESFCLHGIIDYSVIDYKAFFLDVGVSGDAFVQFDYDGVNTHYTGFTIGPYLEIGCNYEKGTKDNVLASIAVNFPIYSAENKVTDFFEPEDQEIESWNEILGHNDAFLVLLGAMIKISAKFPL